MSSTPAGTAALRSARTGSSERISRRLLIAATVAYATVVAAVFVVLPVRDTGGLWFYHYHGSSAVVILFAPLVVLALALVFRRVREVATLVAILLMVVVLVQQLDLSWGLGSRTVGVVTLLAMALAAGALIAGRRTADASSAVSAAEARTQPVHHSRTLLLIRRVGAVVLAAAAMWVVFNLTPADTTSYQDYRVAAAMADDRANQSGAQGAPQQAVVNGWTARDLLDDHRNSGRE